MWLKKTKLVCFCRSTFYKHWSSHQLSSRDKGNESVDNYPVQSFFSGRSAFCDSNTSRFISLSVLYQPQYKLCPTRKFLASRLTKGVVVLHPKNTKWPIMWYFSWRKLWQKKCLVNFDAFIGKTIGSDIWPDWIYLLIPGRRIFLIAQSRIRQWKIWNQKYQM